MAAGERLRGRHPSSTSPPATMAAPSSRARRQGPWPGRRRSPPPRGRRRSGTPRRRRTGRRGAGRRRPRASAPRRRRRRPARARGRRGRQTPRALQTPPRRPAPRLPPPAAPAARRRRPRCAPGSAPPAARSPRRRAAGRRGPRPRCGRASRAGAPAASCGIEGDHDAGVRQQAAGGEQVELQHIVDAQAASVALIGERRVDVAVDEHHPSGGQRRHQHVVSELGASGRVEERLGPGLHVGAVVQQAAPDALTERRAARLAQRAAGRTRRSRPGSRARSRAARSRRSCVDLPQPSMPSRLMKAPSGAAGGGAHDLAGCRAPRAALVQRLVAGAAVEVDALLARAARAHDADHGQAADGAFLAGRHDLAERRQRVRLPAAAARRAVVGLRRRRALRPACRGRRRSACPSSC